MKNLAFEVRFLAKYIPASKLNYYVGNVKKNVENDIYFNFFNPTVNLIHNHLSDIINEKLKK